MGEVASFDGWRLKIWRFDCWRLNIWNGGYSERLHEHIFPCNYSCHPFINFAKEEKVHEYKKIWKKSTLAGGIFVRLWKPDCKIFTTRIYNAEGHEITIQFSSLNRLIVFKIQTGLTDDFKRTMQCCQQLKNEKVCSSELTNDWKVEGKPRLTVWG